MIGMFGLLTEKKTAQYGEVSHLRMNQVSNREKQDYSGAFLLCMIKWSYRAEELSLFLIEMIKFVLTKEASAEYNSRCFTATYSSFEHDTIDRTMDC